MTLVHPHHNVRMVVLIVTTVIENVFVIVVMFYHKHVLIALNFIASLADLLVALIVMPFHVSTNIAIKCQYGSVFCDLWLTFGVLQCTVCVFWNIYMISLYFLNIDVIVLNR